MDTPRAGELPRTYPRATRRRTHAPHGKDPFVITGYATYLPAEPPDPVEDRYYAARLDMIERKAAKYPALLARRATDEAGAIRLEITLSQATQDLASFVRELEDSDLGYLYWETTTEKERDSLMGIEVAVTTVDVVAPTETLRPGASAYQEPSGPEKGCKTQAPRKIPHA